MTISVYANSQLKRTNCSRIILKGFGLIKFGLKGFKWTALLGIMKNVFLIKVRKLSRRKTYAKIIKQFTQ